MLILRHQYRNNSQHWWSNQSTKPVMPTKTLAKTTRTCTASWRTLALQNMQANMNNMKHMPRKQLSATSQFENYLARICQRYLLHRQNYSLKLSSCAKHFILHAEKAVQQSNCSCKPYISNVNANMKAHHDGKWSHLSLKTTVFACAEEKNPASTKLLSVIVILRHSFPLCKRYMYEFASH